ncbi:MAG: 50S ribosomal protein L35 [Patescibacteria group bacterium]
MSFTGKTNKSLAKRIKISGTGKVMKRPPGQNHFNSKATGDQSRDKRGDKIVPHELIDKVKALIFK